ncbi:MAG: hypothetical protein AB7O32_00150 [Vicinamibacterales bacterium]
MNDPLPTVGRVVHYTPVDGATRKGQPYAAVITHVWGPDCVNLSVQPDGSFPLIDPTPTSVVKGDPGTPRTWCWPPRA